MKYVYAMTDFFLRQISSRWKDLYKNEQKIRWLFMLKKKGYPFSNSGVTVLLRKLTFPFSVGCIMRIHVPSWKEFSAKTCFRDAFVIS